jgi:hypothetical protein
MRNSYYLLFFLLFFAISGYSQDTVKMRKFKLDFGVGGVTSSFQDLKYSAVHWTGFGVMPKFEMSWRKKSIHIAGFDGIVSFENPKTFDTWGKTNVYEVTPYYRYLHPVYNSGNQNIFVGTEINPIDISIRMIDGLSNNGTYIIQSINIKGYTLYEKKFSDKLVVNAQLGLQLLSFMYEGVGFAYAEAQNILEDGDYTYDELKMSFKTTPIWNYLNIETRIGVSYGKRWLFSYKWKMQQSYIVPDYTMTKGYSALMVTYHIMSRTKNINKK